MPAAEREELRGAFMPVQLAIGWGFPNALMQYACPALESVSIDIAELTRKRDRLYGALTDAGYTLTRPEGTFYLWGVAPGGDARAYCRCAGRRGRLRHAGDDLRPPRAFPALPHRDDGHDRTRAASARRGRTAQLTPDQAPGIAAEPTRVTCRA